MTEITWCKLFHDFADDAKFLRVADITGATVELVQACFARALCRASSNPDRGSTKDIDLNEFAWWFKKPIELIRSIFDAFEQVGRMITEGRLANWAKRQGLAAAKLAKTVAAEAEAAISSAALRTRRWRQRKARDPRQQEMFFVVPGGAAAAQAPASPRRSHPVTAPSPGPSPEAADREDRLRDSPPVAPPGGGDTPPRFSNEVIPAHELAFPLTGGRPYANSPRRRRSARQTLFDAAARLTAAREREMALSREWGSAAGPGDGLGSSAA